MTPTYLRPSLRVVIADKRLSVSIGIYCLQSDINELVARLNLSVVRFDQQAHLSSLDIMMKVALGPSANPLSSLPQKQSKAQKAKKVKKFLEKSLNKTGK